jgi:AhpD family alkylhydroperoxidase
MTRENTIDLVSRDEASGKVAEVYEEIVASRSGEVDDDASLNRLWTVYGNKPELLEIFWDHMKETYRGGSLPFDLQHKVALVVATVMECEGCKFFHSSTLESEGVEDQEIDEIQEQELEETGFSRMEYEVLKFAEKAATDAHGITDEEFETLREVGLSDPEIVELIDCIAVHAHIAILLGATGVSYEGMSEEEFLGPIES